MGARLVQLDEDGRRVVTVRLGADELVIGRDAQEADLVVEQSARVSRRHALVRPAGRGFELVDLGSANGTTLNGDAVTRPERLEHGDSIELGGDVELRFEQSRGGSVLGAVVVVLLLGALGAGGWWWTNRQEELQHQAVMQRAAKMADEAMTAAEAGNPEMAKQRFQSAAGLLFREGLLDDVERDVLMRTAMERIGAELGKGVDLWSEFRKVHQELAKRQQLAHKQEEQKAVIAGTPTTPSCRLDAVSPAEYDACLRQWVRQVLEDLKQEPKQDLPDEFMARIASRQCIEHGFIRRSLGRGTDVVPMMKVELEKKYLPPAIHYLSLIESGYQAGALSTAAAMGPWQFIPETGRRYGLAVGGPNDERRDFQKSTVAAANYLNDLLFDFGGDDLLLALASYNRGEQGVRNALRKLENPFSERSYWRLVEKGLLPDETALYVARFLAAAAAGEGGLPEVETLETALHACCKDDRKECR